MEQTIPIEGILQLVQRRLFKFVKNDSDAADAFRISRVIPPFSATGNSTWTGGFIKRGAAFSGLPIRTPIDFENLFLIVIPVLFVNNSKTESEVPKSRVFPKIRWFKIWTSIPDMMTFSSTTLCGIPKFSKICFLEIS